MTVPFFWNTLPMLFPAVAIRVKNIDSHIAISPRFGLAELNNGDRSPENEKAKERERERERSGLRRGVLGGLICGLSGFFWLDPIPVKKSDPWADPKPKMTSDLLTHFHNFLFIYY